MRNVLFASLCLLLSSVSVMSACKLETRPQAVGSGGLGQMTCAPLSACDAGIATSVAGKAGSAGTAGPAAGSAGRASAGAGGMPISGVGVPPAGGTGGVTMPDGGPPVPSLDVGKACTEDMQCKTGHCDGVCCASGDCCSTIADCNPTSVGGIQLACNDPATCQGSGGAIQCMNSRCVAVGGAPNDSACLSTTLANSCGAYLPVYCNGMADQHAPACPTSCQTNANCKPNAHCDNATCVPNVDNGGACAKDQDCTSGHCNNRICCGSGDCCQTPNQCPASYTAPATCDTPETCQGTAKEAACSNWQCKSNVVLDDSACTTTTLANNCGAKADVYCKGTKNQVAQGCGGNACTADGQCDKGAFCNLSASPPACKPKAANSTACTTNNMCASNSCGSNNICCVDAQVQCCVRVEDCQGPQYSSKTCDHPETCLGSMMTPTCNVNNGMCATSPVTNVPEACAGTINLCGAYAQATCPAHCKTMCTTLADCAAGNTCVANVCMPMSMPVAGTSGAGMSMPTP
jgi:hypothetical protein